MPHKGNYALVKICQENKYLKHKVNLPAMGLDLTVSGWHERAQHERLWVFPCERGTFIGTGGCACGCWCCWFIDLYLSGISKKTKICPAFLMNC